MSTEKMIMIPESRYDKMVESYDKAVSELECLRKQLGASDKNGDRDETTAIENIFYNRDYLISNYVDFPETKKVWEDIDKHLKKCEIIGSSEKIGSCRKEQMNDLYDLISGACASHEKQGFIYGFYYAMSLIAAGKAVAV